MPPWHMSWSQAPMLYSSLMYQHQAGASRYQLAHQRTGGTVLPEYFLVNFVDSKVTRMKHFHLTGFLFNLQVDRDVSSQFDAWGLCGESPPASVLTEDEFLEMVLGSYLS